MAKRAEAMRAENERVKRQTEQRLARKRNEEAQKSGSGVKSAAVSAVAKSPVLRNVNWGASGIAVLVASIILVIVLIVNKRKGLAPEPSLPEVEGTTEVAEPSETSSASTVSAEAPSVAETIPELVAAYPPPYVPGEPPVSPLLPPPAVPSVPEPPTSPPRASMRWAALRLPEQCFQFPSAPHGILPGLEVYDFGEKESTLETLSNTAEALAEVTQNVTAEEASNIVEEENSVTGGVLENVKEGVSSAASLLTEAVPQLAASLNEAITGEPRQVAGGEVSTEDAETEVPATEGAVEGTEEMPPASELDFQAGAEQPPAEQLAAGQPQYARRMLLQKRKARGGRPEDATDVEPSTKIEIQQQSAAISAAKSDNLLPSSTELQAMNLLLNVSAVDGSCQFVTAECAEAAAMQLADALRADAEAVSSPKVSAAELKRVSENLATLHSNSRTLLNSSELPSLGKNGALGNCAVAGEAEYDPATGARYDAFTSRFAVAIDRHDVLVHCAETLHYCTITRLQETPIRTSTIRIDAQSFVAAKKDGQQLHELLAADLELGDGVAAWRHAGEPTHSFLTLMLLLRSGLCQRIDVYGQPGVPSAWYKNVGNGHIITQPGNTKEDKSLAASLQQERFALRVAVHVFQGRLCFYK